jgi:hypothetical protein
MKDRVLAGAASQVDSIPLSPKLVAVKSTNCRASSIENPQLAADLRELLNLTARMKVAQCGDVDDPDIATELRAVEREWQRFKATRAGRREK